MSKFVDTGWILLASPPSPSFPPSIQSCSQVCIYPALTCPHTGWTIQYELLIIMVPQTVIWVLHRPKPRERRQGGTASGRWAAGGTASGKRHPSPPGACTRAWEQSEGKHAHQCRLHCVIGQIGQAVRAELLCCLTASRKTRWTPRWNVVVTWLTYYRVRSIIQTMERWRVSCWC